MWYDPLNINATFAARILAMESLSLSLPVSFSLLLSFDTRIWWISFIVDRASYGETITIVGTGETTI